MKKSILKHGSGKSADEGASAYATYITTNGQWGGFPEAEAIASAKNFKTGVFIIDDDKLKKLDDIGTGTARNANLLWKDNHYLVIKDSAQNGETFEKSLVLHDPEPKGNCLFEAMAYIWKSDCATALNLFPNKSYRSEQIQYLRTVARDNLSPELMEILNQEITRSSPPEETHSLKESSPLWKEIDAFCKKYSFDKYYAFNDGTAEKTKFALKLRKDNKKTDVKPRPSESLVSFLLSSPLYKQEKAVVEEKSSIKKEFNQKVACVLQSLFNAKHRPFEQKCAKDLHNLIWSKGGEALGYDEFKEYDMDSVYPKLYNKAGLTKVPCTGQTADDLAVQLKTGYYILEFAGSSQAGHNTVIEVNKVKKEYVAKIIDDPNNKSKVRTSDLVSAYWTKE